MDIKPLKSNILFHSPFVLKKNKTLLFILSSVRAQNYEKPEDEFVAFVVRNLLRS